MKAIFRGWMGKNNDYGFVTLLDSPQRKFRLKIENALIKNYDNGFSSGFERGKQLERRHQEVNRSQSSRSPDGRSRSPDRRRRSPDGRSRSPDMRRRSPDRRRRSPDRRSRSRDRYIPEEYSPPKNEVQFVPHVHQNEFIPYDPRYHPMVSMGVTQPQMMQYAPPLPDSLPQYKKYWSSKHNRFYYVDDSGTSHWM